MARNGRSLFYPDLVYDSVAEGEPVLCRLARLPVRSMGAQFVHNGELSVKLSKKIVPRALERLYSEQVTLFREKGESDLLPASTFLLPWHLHDAAQERLDKS